MPGRLAAAMGEDLEARAARRCAATRLASMATTMHCAPNFSAAARTKSRSFTAAVLIETLSAPASSSVRTSSVLAHAAADGERHEAALGRAVDHVEDGAALLVARGDVEEAEFVGAGLVIGGGGLDRIAGVAQIDEVDALDDAALLHVEAGYDADLQHRQDLGLRAGCVHLRAARLYGAYDPDDASTRSATRPAATVRETNQTARSHPVRAAGRC